MGAADSHRGARRGRSGRRRRRWWGLAVVVAVAAGAVPFAATAADPTAVEYQQTNLISDIPGVARITDPNLVNPWGQAASPTSPLWVADNGADVSTLYTGGVHGSITVNAPLVVTVPEDATTAVVHIDTHAYCVH